VLLGAWLVERPVSGLRHALQALGDGQLPPPPRRRRRDELGVLAEDLRAVGERLAEKERLRHADRLRTVGQLAAGIAHQLGTPLSVVRVRAGMIVSGDVEGDEVKQNARQVVDQVDRISALVRQLLDYSRRQGGRAAPVDVRTVVATSLDLLRPLAERAGVRLDWSQPREPILVRADTIQLEQVVTNLVMNAVQAMPSGGTVRVEAEAAPATNPGRAAAGAGVDEVLLRVIDDGPGIAPEHLPHVFEPFYTTKAVGEGSGLGLAVVQAIVEEHGGRVEVESNPGVGTRFTVHLAAAHEEERLAS
jgi:signal transduction histidine kinase